MFMTKCYFESCQFVQTALLLTTRASTFSYICCSNLHFTSAGDQEALFIKNTPPIDSFFKIMYSSLYGTNNEVNAKSIISITSKCSIQYQNNNMSKFRQKQDDAYISLKFNDPRCLTVSMSTFYSLTGNGVIQITPQENLGSHLVIFCNFHDNYYSEYLAYLNMHTGTKITFKNCVFDNSDTSKTIFENTNSNSNPVYVYDCIFNGDIKFINGIVTSGNSVYQNNINYNQIEHYAHDGKCYAKYDENVIDCTGENCEEEKACPDNAFDFGENDIPYDTPSPSLYFSESNFFSETNDFTFSFVFTESKKFQPTNIFTESTAFTKTGFFSESTKFSESIDFTKSEKFSKSENFDPTNKFSSSAFFSNSIAFTETGDFTKTGFFSESTKFSESIDFTKSSIFIDTSDFTKSIEFTTSFYFSSSTYFSNSKEFTKTTQFTESTDFTVSNYFSRSCSFTDSEHWDRTHSFTSSKTFTPSNDFSTSFFFSNSKKFTETDDFTMTDGFTKTGLFSETDKFSETNDFTKSGLFSSSNGFVQTSFFSKSGYFSESADFSNTKFFSESIDFTISSHFTDSNYYIFTSTESFVHRNVIIDIKQDESKKSNIPMKIGVGVAFGVAAIAAVIIAGIFFLRKRKLASIEDINEETINVTDDIGHSMITQNPLNTLMSDDDPFEEEFI